MIVAPIPENEDQRIAELYKYELNDEAYEEEFQDIVKLASGLCDMPMSLITLIDVDRQFFKAKIGIDANETSRNAAFCSHAILNDDLFEINNTLEDERFFDNPYVSNDPNIRYYAGMPLITANGYKLGTLCVLDNVPRKLTEDQYMVLKVLSKQVIKLFELRVRNKELNKAKAVQQKMMSIMAHDIRGPLASIQMVLDYKVTHHLADDKVREIETLVSEQLKGTINMLNNIVDWGKLQLNNAEDNAFQFNLHQLCTDCFQSQLLASQSKNNNLVNNIPEDFLVHTNLQGLEFVLRNLISNANKFTKKGTISVSAALGHHNFFMCIEDTGVGIEQAEIELLNHQKWSVQNIGTSNEKGSGMGLQLIYEYLSNINATISFDSKPGKGTKVTVALPQI